METKCTFLGQELEIVNEKVVFDKPIEMLAWNHDNYPTKRTIVAILPNGTAIDIDHNWIENCAYIPEALKPRTIPTNKELAEWCAKGNGQIHCVGAANVHTFYSYQNENDDSPVTRDIRIRKFGDKEWVEPTLEYIGIKLNSVLDSLVSGDESLPFKNEGCESNAETVPSKHKAKKFDDDDDAFDEDL